MAYSSSSSSIPVTVMEVEDENTAFPNWLELPRDITANILKRLDTVEIVTNACQVCPLWHNIFKDPLMWRTINMCCNYSEYRDTDTNFAKICRYLVERSCGYLDDIVIELFCTDDLLECIAENAGNLQIMRLAHCSNISDKGFSEAVMKLPLLKEVEITFCNLSKDSLEILGHTCPLLKSLKYSKISYERYGSNDDEAYAITKTMFGLYHLDIKGNRLTDVGLLAILDGCPFLESLDIQECYMFTLNESLKKRCIEQIKDLQLPDLNNYDDQDSVDQIFGNYVSYQDSALEYYDDDYSDDFYE